MGLDKNVNCAVLHGNLNMDVAPKLPGNEGKKLSYLFHGMLLHKTDLEISMRNMSIFYNQNGNTCTLLFV